MSININIIVQLLMVGVGVIDTSFSTAPFAAITGSMWLIGSILFGAIHARCQ
ncbi:MAG: hypothetical protein JHC33_07835 [Ignisphaera sp.]|nr:hypothetical protein [Ignisphaera sp.]